MHELMDQISLILAMALKLGGNVFEGEKYVAILLTLILMAAPCKLWVWK